MGSGNKGHEVANRLPEWLRIRFADNEQTGKVAALISGSGLNSVCQSAHCPNRHECWAKGTATFMVMGDTCTRACRFCAIKSSPKPNPPDPLEPERLAGAIASLGLRYIVLTSVTRDDLPEGGSPHFAECVRAIKRASPGLIIESLVPDFNCERPAMICMIESGSDVISHNIETVERLTPLVRDRRAGYRKSLEALRSYRELSGGKTITKSGLMLGFGESGDEVEAAMADLRAAGVDILTIGQYLRPSKKPRHLPVAEYVTLEMFAKYEKAAYSLGFRYVASGPLVRSSYRAAEPFERGLLRSTNSY